eukprot:gene8010-12475_t
MSKLEENTKKIQNEQEEEEEEEEITEEEEEEEEYEEEEEEEEEDDDEEGETDDEDEDEDDEDAEPQLKYQRILGSLPKIFEAENQTNHASALAVSDKFLALGTHVGHLYLLDFEGNEIKDKKFASHSQTVTDLSIDKSGEYLASCSTDGKVMIHGLYNSDKMEYYFNRPVNTIAIDPEYAKSKEKPIVAGGKSGKLILFKKGWFSNKEIVIHEGEGEIHSVRWRKSLIVWSNDKGVKIFDDATQTKIAFIARADKSSRPDMFRCCFDWVEGLENGKEKLIVGWGTMLKIIGVTFNPTTKTYKCENLSTFKVDFYICGVTPFADNLLILAFDEDEEEMKKSKKYIAPRPELRVVNVKGEELVCDALAINGYEKLFATHYKLEHNTFDEVYYIVAQSDIIAAKPRDLTDHLQWLIEKERFVEALQCARENEKKLINFTLYDVGKEYIKHLLFKEKDFSKAAQSVPAIVKNEKNLWEEWINYFVIAGKFSEILPYIPTENPRLSNEIYEMILNNYLMLDHEKFYLCLKNWENDMYDMNSIITKLNEKIESSVKFSNSEHLLNSLGLLYSFQQDYDKALFVYLKLKKSDVFDFIEKHDLYFSIKNEVRQLIEFDEPKALELLINSTDKIPISVVIGQLKKEHQHRYLDALFKKSKTIAEDYHLLQVKLYAEFEPKNLLFFLENSYSYEVDSARDTLDNFIDFHKNNIENQNYVYRGIVYLHGRMGNTDLAMDIIINKLNDVDLAIEFVEQQKDPDLWEELINYSLNNSHFISGLLDHIGDHIDPLSLISKIPNQMEIEGLKMKLAKIISDFTLQMTLQKGCKNIMKADGKVLSSELYKKQRKGVKVSFNPKCASCHVEMKQSNEDTISFFCGHTYHISCIRDDFYKFIV